MTIWVLGAEVYISYAMVSIQSDYETTRHEKVVD